MRNAWVLRVCIILLLLLLLVGCASGKQKDDIKQPEQSDHENSDISTDVTAEEIIEAFGIGTETFDQLTYGDIELTNDEGKGLLEYTIDYSKHDLNVKKSDFEFDDDLYFILSQDLELLTHVAMEDVIRRNDEKMNKDTLDMVLPVDGDTDILAEKYNLYTGITYVIQNIGVVELDIDAIFQLVYGQEGIIEFSWFNDLITWENDEIKEKYDHFIINASIN